MASRMKNARPNNESTTPTLTGTLPLVTQPFMTSKIRVTADEIRPVAPAPLHCVLRGAVELSSWTGEVSSVKGSVSSLIRSVSSGESSAPGDVSGVNGSALSATASCRLTGSGPAGARSGSLMRAVATSPVSSAARRSLKRLTQPIRKPVDAPKTTPENPPSLKPTNAPTSMKTNNTTLLPNAWLRRISERVNLPEWEEM